MPDYSHTYQMIANGYRLAPPPEAEEIDAEIVAHWPCPVCDGKQEYEGWCKPGSYIALAVCRECGKVTEF